MVCPTCHIYLGQMLEKVKDLASESSPRGWYLVAIVPIYFGKLYKLWIFADIHISMAHIIHDREIWSICKGYVGDGTQDCAPGTGACFIRTCQFPSYLSSSPTYWR